MPLYTTNLHYAGRPIVRDKVNRMFYVASKHRTSKTANKRNEKRDNPANIWKLGNWYLAIYRLPSDKEKEARSRL